MSGTTISRESIQSAISNLESDLAGTTDYTQSVRIQELIDNLTDILSDQPSASAIAFSNDTAQSINDINNNQDDADDLKTVLSDLSSRYNYEINPFADIGNNYNDTTMNEVGSLIANADWQKNILSYGVFKDAYNKLVGGGLNAEQQRQLLRDFEMATGTTLEPPLSSLSAQQIGAAFNQLKDVLSNVEQAGGKITLTLLTSALAFSRDHAIVQSGTAEEKAAAFARMQGPTGSATQMIANLPAGKDFKSIHKKALDDFLAAFDAVDDKSVNKTDIIKQMIYDVTNTGSIGAGQIMLEHALTLSHLSNKDKSELVENFLTGIGLDNDKIKLRIPEKGSMSDEDYYALMIDLYSGTGGIKEKLKSMADQLGVDMYAISSMHFPAGQHCIFLGIQMILNTKSNNIQTDPLYIQENLYFFARSLTAFESNKTAAVFDSIAKPFMEQMFPGGMNGTNFTHQMDVIMGTTNFEGVDPAAANIITSWTLNTLMGVPANSIAKDSINRSNQMNTIFNAMSIYNTQTNGSNLSPEQISKVAAWAGAIYSGNTGAIESAAAAALGALGTPSGNATGTPALGLMQHIVALTNQKSPAGERLGDNAANTAFGGTATTNPDGKSEPFSTFLIASASAVQYYASLLDPSGTSTYFSTAGMDEGLLTAIREYKLAQASGDIYEIGLHAAEIEQLIANDANIVNKQAFAQGLGIPPADGHGLEQYSRFKTFFTENPGMLPISPPLNAIQAHNFDAWIANPDDQTKLTALFSELKTNNTSLIDKIGTYLKSKDKETMFNAARNDAGVYTATDVGLEEFLTTNNISTSSLSEAQLRELRNWYDALLKKNPYDTVKAGGRLLAMLGDTGDKTLRDAILKETAKQSSTWGTVDNFKNKGLYLAYAIQAYAEVAKKITAGTAIDLSQGQNDALEQKLTDWALSLVNGKWNNTGHETHTEELYNLLKGLGFTGGSTSDSFYNTALEVFRYHYGAHTHSADDPWKDAGLDASKIPDYFEGTRAPTDPSRFNFGAYGSYSKKFKENNALPIVTDDDTRKKYAVEG